MWDFRILPLAAFLAHLIKRAVPINWKLIYPRALIRDLSMNDLIPYLLILKDSQFVLDLIKKKQDISLPKTDACRD